MNILKKVCSVLLSILIFMVTIIVVLLIIFNTFINSGIVENTFETIVEKLKEEEFITINSDNFDNSKFIVKKYDDNGNYIGDSEIDISNIDLTEISNVVEGYFEQILDYLSNYDDSGKKLYLDGSKLINPIMTEYEKVLSEFELKENIQLDRNEVKVETEKLINEMFIEINKELDNILTDENMPISYISNITKLLINKNLIIILVIIDILMCGLVILINRQIYSIFYIVVPLGLSSWLILSILWLLSVIISKFMFYLIGAVPLLIAIGLVIFFYFYIRNKQ